MPPNCEAIGTLAFHNAEARGVSSSRTQLSFALNMAADASLSALQAKLAAHNLCVASANLLDLIRTLRLSALLMDEEAIAAEEEEECEECQNVAKEAVGESVQLEAELMNLRNDVDAGR